MKEFMRLYLIHQMIIDVATWKLQYCMIFDPDYMLQNIRPIDDPST